MPKINQLSTDYSSILKAVSRKRIDKLPHFYKDQLPVFFALLLGLNLTISSKNDGRSLVFFYRRKVEDQNSKVFVQFLFRRFRNLIPVAGMWSSIRTYSCWKTHEQYFIFRSRCMPIRVFRNEYINFSKGFEPSIVLPSNLTRAIFSEKMFAFLFCDTGSIQFCVNSEGYAQGYVYRVRIKSFSSSLVLNLAKFFRETYGFDNVEILWAYEYYIIKFSCSFNSIQLLVKPHLTPALFGALFQI